MTAGHQTATEIDAAPPDVFAALTTLGGLAAWRAPTVTGSPEQRATRGNRVSPARRRVLVGRNLWPCLASTT